jgi:hypothetical protein
VSLRQRKQVAISGVMAALGRQIAAQDAIGT